MIETKHLLKQARKYKIDPGRDIDADSKTFVKDVTRLLDRLHDKIDLASWESASREFFFPTSNGCRALDVGKLKIEELEELVFYPFEFKLLKLLCLKDDYSFEHSLKVMAISLRVADMFGVSNNHKKTLAKAAALHDIGKASRDPETCKDYIDDYILKSYYNAIATTAELDVLKTHVTLGIRDLQKAYAHAGIDGSAIIDIIEKHHERLDGSGYPAGIRLDEQDIFPQILAFSDTIEAMTAEQRTWQKTCSFDEIRQCFEQHLTGKFSSAIVNIILDDPSRDLIEQEVAESRSVTQKIFIDL